MLIERSFDVTDLIEQGGSNTVQVIIRPVVLGAQDHLLGSFSMGNFATEESVYIRKAPHMYGWDIMPRLVSAGLWRGVELRTLNPARFTDVNWVTTHVDTASRNVSLFVDFQTRLPFDQYDKAKVRFTLFICPTSAENSVLSSTARKFSYAARTGFPSTRCTAATRRSTRAR